jgi:hypothetical protein
VVQKWRQNGDHGNPSQDHQQIFYPKKGRSGAAIAKPTGLKIIEPIASKANGASDYGSTIVQM